MAVERQCSECQRDAIGSSVILFVSGHFGLRLGSSSARLKHKELPKPGNTWRSEFSVTVEDASEQAATLVEAGLALMESYRIQASAKHAIGDLSGSFMCARAHALMRLGEADRRVALKKAQSSRSALSAEICECNGLTLNSLHELYCLAGVSEYAKAIATREVRAYRIHKFFEPPLGQSIRIDTEVYRDPSETSSLLSLRYAVHLASSLEVVAVGETSFR